MRTETAGSRGVSSGRIGSKFGADRDLGGTRLRFMMTNANSFMSKRAEMELFVGKQETDIIAITESWASEEILDAELALEGFVMFRRDRRRTPAQKGGGVLMYAREGLMVEEILDLNSGNCEALWGRMLVKGKEITLGVCYRSMNNADEEDNALLETVDRAAKNSVILMGDFNYPDINWEEGRASGKGEKFLDTVQNNFLYQHVKEPTRGMNILDLVLTDDLNMVDNVRCEAPFGRGDHAVVCFDVNIDCSRVEKKIESFDFGRANWIGLNKDLLEIDWNERFKERSVHEMWSILVEVLEEKKREYIPLKSKIGKKKPIWMNYKACKALKRKYRMWKLYKDSPEGEKFERFKRARNEAVRELRKSKKLFEEKIAKNIRTDSKSFFSYARKNYVSRERIGPLKNDEGELVQGNEEMCEVLNKAFVNVFTKEAVFSGNEGKFRDTKNLGGMPGVIFTEDMVSKQFDKMKENKAAGNDGMGSTFLKAVGRAISMPLVMLFQKSVDEGEIPMQWREANVTAIYKKKGKKCDPGNYRPVSLTSQLGKLCERVIRDAVVHHMEGNGLIGGSQHGFRKGKSCLTNLLEFLDEVGDNVDRGIPVDVIYLDFAKAFDKVPHMRLLYKLERYGINANIVRWIKTWLSGRRQRVVIGDKYSGWEEVWSGVPQGSVLGPILFIIYINDLEENVLNKIWKFADDTKLMGRVDSEESVRLLQEDLNELFRWSEEWLMQFNIEKCNVMHMGFNNKRSEVNLGVKVLSSIVVEKDLGVMIQDNLKVEAQCNKAANAANRMLGMIKRNFGCRSREVVVPLYKALVRPHLDYCIQAWRPHLRKDIDRLEKIQRRATKLVEGLTNWKYEDRLKELGLTTLETRMIRADMIEVYKIFKGLDRMDKEKFFTMSKVNTRGHSLGLFKRRFKLDVGKYGFGNRVCDDWNALTEDVVAAETLLNFKIRLDRYLRKSRGFI